MLVQKCIFVVERKIRRFTESFFQMNFGGEVKFSLEVISTLGFKTGDEVFISFKIHFLFAPLVTLWVKVEESNGEKRQEENHFGITDKVFNMNVILIFFRPIFALCLSLQKPIVENFIYQMQTPPFSKIQGWKSTKNGFSCSLFRQKVYIQHIFPKSVDDWRTYEKYTKSIPSIQFSFILVK